MAKYKALTGSSVKGLKVMCPELISGFEVCNIWAAVLCSGAFPQINYSDAEYYE